MLLRLQSASNAMRELDQQQARTANNLANAGTHGFQRTRTFTEALAQRMDAEGAPASQRTTSAFADRTRGALDATGNPLDLALASDGFFVLDGPDGQPRYTRNGHFMPDADGTLRSADGLPVLDPEGRPILLPPGSAIEIARDGSIAVDGRPVGQLAVVGFAEDAPLAWSDGATFITDAAPVAVAADVRQGFLETSNVNPVAEMADMITQYRLFESHQKILQAHDALLGRAAELGRF